MKAPLHPDHAAIDRIGVARLMSHFNITRQAISLWRYGGVPKIHRQSVAMLGTVIGKPAPEMSAPRNAEA